MAMGPVELLDHTEYENRTVRCYQSVWDTKLIQMLSLGLLAIQNNRNMALQYKIEQMLEKFSFIK